MTLAEITSSKPHRFRRGAVLYLQWPDFWVLIDNGQLGQWVGYWSRAEVEAVVARADVDEAPEPRI